MSDNDLYTRYLTRSVNHIFKNFLEDNNIEEIYETQSSAKDARVAVEFTGTLEGEILISIPDPTLKLITKKFINKKDATSINASKPDVAGELANLISGTFANQLQYVDHSINLSPPEFNDDPLEVKTFFENINISFNSIYGGFDIDLYYKEDE
jgi:CheY-specific phosphatase CheX